MLRITGQREDGYHTLQSVFQLLDYQDTLHFKVTEDGKIFQSQAIEGIEEDKNLCIRAAKALQAYSKTHYGVEIALEKKIPMGAGLGGGSSNAATVLVALNKLWNINLSTEALIKLGLQLGADVPIFIYGKPAWAEGIGEILTPISLPQKDYLVIYPNVQVATKTIFTDKNLTRNSPPITIAAFQAGIDENDCQPVVVQHYPVIQKALHWLSQYGQAKLTGTGSCIFAAFSDTIAARKILEQLPSDWQGFATSSLNMSPLLEKVS